MLADVPELQAWAEQRRQEQLEAGLLAYYNGRKAGENNKYRGDVLADYMAGKDWADAIYAAGANTQSFSEQPFGNGSSFNGNLWEVSTAALNYGGIGANVYSASQISRVIEGPNMIIYGGRNYRSFIGLNPYTNRIGLSNAQNLSSVSRGAFSSMSSPFTIGTAGVLFTRDTVGLFNGDYSVPEYKAAVTIDVGSTFLSSGAGGIVTGYTIGPLTALAGPAGTVTSVILGALVTAATSDVLSMVNEDMMKTLTMMNETIDSVNSNPNRYWIEYP